MALRTEVLRTKIDLDNREANRAADQHVTKIKSAERSIGSSTDKMGKGFKELKSAMLGVGVAVGSIGAAVYAIDRLAERADAISNLSRGFDTLSGRIDTSASVFLPKLRAASHGLVSDMELMRQANNAVILGVAKSDDEFAQLTETALKLGRAVGLDATRAIESLVTGIGRQSRLMLDNLGIIVRVEEANEAYARSLGKTVAELTDAERKQAFFTATMKAADEASQNLSVTANTLSERWNRVKTAISNTTAAWLEWINRPREGAGEYGWLSAFGMELQRRFAPPGYYERPPLAAPGEGRTKETQDAFEFLQSTIGTPEEIQNALASNYPILEMWDLPGQLEPIKSEFHDLWLSVSTMPPPDLSAMDEIDKALYEHAEDRAQYEYDTQQWLQDELIALRIANTEYGSEEYLRLIDEQNRREQEKMINHLQLLAQMRVLSEEQVAAAIAAIKKGETDYKISQDKRGQDTAVYLTNAMLSLVTQGNKRTAKEHKRLAYFAAIVSTAAGVARAYQDYSYPYSLYVAMQVLAAGLAQVAAISSASYGGGGSPGPVPGGEKTTAQTTPIAPMQYARRGDYSVNVFIEGEGFIEDKTQLARELSQEIQNQMNRGGA